jgi:hypothetical protein
LVAVKIVGWWLALGVVVVGFLFWFNFGLLYLTHHEGVPNGPNFITTSMRQTQKWFIYMYSPSCPWLLVESKPKSSSHRQQTRQTQQWKP